MAPQPRASLGNAAHQQQQQLPRSDAQRGGEHQQEGQVQDEQRMELDNDAPQQVTALSQTEEEQSGQAASAAATGEDADGPDDENQSNAQQQQQQQQQQAPVKPGPRATRLHQLYAQSLRHTLGKLGWDNFAGCYPTVARRAEPVLRQVQAQMVDKLGDKCEKEFENIMVARQVVPKLNQLEELVTGAARRRAEANPSDPQPTPPHLLPPSDILSAHLHPALVAHQSQLNARLQTTQSQNALLFDEVRRQRDEIDRLLAQLEAAVADVSAANEALASVVPQVVAEARQSDVDLGADVAGGSRRGPGGG